MADPAMVRIVEQLQRYGLGADFLAAWLHFCASGLDGPVTIHHHKGHMKRFSMEMGGVMGTRPDAVTALCDAIQPLLHNMPVLVEVVS
jgi:hypothetical protein